MLILNQRIKDKLKENWGERAIALEVYAEVKLFDPLSSWICYLFAMDENEQYVQGLFYSNLCGYEIEIMEWNDLQNMFNEEGDNPQIDEEYRRMTVKEILKRLRRNLSFS